VGRPDLSKYRTSLKYQAFLRFLQHSQQDANVASAKEEAEANLRELENVRGQLEQDRENALKELEEQKQR
jgi:multidrug resistance efflux pump